MKKVFTLMVGVAFIASLSSCKKDWDCTCTYSVAGVSATATYTYNATKKDAEDACGKVEVTGYTCDLKKK